MESFKPKTDVYPRIPEKEWHEKGEELFGDDVSNWEFICPRCRNVMSIATAVKSFQGVLEMGWSPAQECVGIYSDKIHCRWSSYGVLKGPVILLVGNDGKKIPMFDFNGEPFTEPKAMPMQPTTLLVDKYRERNLEIHTGILVRAVDSRGRWRVIDIYYLDKTSLLSWLRSDGGKNELAENTIGELFGHGKLTEPSKGAI